MKTELPIINIEDCFNYSDVVLKLGLSRKGKNITTIKEYILKHNLDTSHFKRNKKLIKYNDITKICPTCQKSFTTKEGPKETTTCSKACANTHFRSGINNPNFKEDGNISYRTICFAYHKKECIICQEKNIVTVHHYDENHLNNEPSNLVPLCPTHHQYVHSRHRDLVIKEIDAYAKQFQRCALSN